MYKTCFKQNLNVSIICVQCHHLLMKTEHKLIVMHLFKKDFHLSPYYCFYFLISSC